jgi:hypothetical protein
MKDAEPRRKRDRTLIIGFSLCLLVVVLAGGYAMYRMILSNRVEKRLEAIRAQGFPVTLGELNDWYPAPPPGHDAADLYQQAFLKYLDDPTWEEKENQLPVVGTGELPPRGEPLPDDMKALIAEYLERNAEALRLLHQAAAMPECRFPIDLRAGAMVLLPHLASLRQGARLMLLEGLLDAEEGRTAEATESVIATVGLADAVRNEPILISYLVRIACLSISCSNLENLLHKAPLDDKTLQELTRTFHDAERPEVAVRAFVGERCFGADFFRNPAGRIAASGGQNVPVHPLAVIGLLDADFRYYLDLMDPQVEMSRLPVEERGKAIEASDLEQAVKDLPSYAIITRMLVPALARALGEETKNVARLRTARTALAVERYRLKHGQLPEGLEALVPEILESVPLDPYDAKPLRYRRLERGYVVYSIGSNMVDDGGIEKVVAPGRLRSRVPDDDIMFIVKR